MSQASETYSLQLATASAPEDLEAWLADAPPRARAIYATGVDLPRSAPGVKLVRRWVEEGLVTCLRARSTDDPRRWYFMVERVGTGVPGPAQDLSVSVEAGCPAPSQAVRARADAMLALLRDLARRHQPCPSYTKLAEQLRFGSGERGRQRARRALALLAQEKKISLRTIGPRGRTRLQVSLTGKGMADV